MGEDELENIKKEEEKMKNELKKLKSLDPEFHEYLEENERDLLDFAEEEDFDDDDDEDNNEIEDSSSSCLITNNDIESYKKETILSIKSLKKLIKVYKNACC